MVPNISFKRIIIAYASFLLVWMIMHMYLLVDFGVDPKMALVDSFITHFIFAITSFILYITLKYYQPSKENFFYIRIWALLLAIGNTLVIVNALQFIYAKDISYQSILSKSIALRFCYQVLMVATITLIQWLGNYMLEQKNDGERQQKAETFAKEAELFNLRQQLQPHFLFNSLNSISALAGSKPEEARKMIQQLSEFLRHTLRKDEQQLVTLQEELYQLNLYLEIEKVRFGYRLKSVVEIDENCAQLLLPVLVLQPLVENAIKFGLYDTLGEVEITIKSRCLDGKWLQIEITNPFDPITHANNAGTGFGIESIKRRLYLLYANNDLVQIEIKENLFLVRVNIPQI